MNAATFDLVRGPNLRQVSQHLAGDMAGLLRQAVNERGRAVLAVPGGTTPREFLTLLSQHDLPWPSIVVMPTDERNVPPDDPRSNERMIRECLPQVRNNLIPLRTAAGSVGATALSKHVASFGLLDAVVLGMGTDTHIASLFPGDPHLERTAWESAPAVLTAHPANLEPRLSLSPLVLMRARWKALLISGQDKLAALSRALEATDPVSAPVRLLFDKGVPPRVYCAE